MSIPTHLEAVRTDSDNTPEGHRRLRCGLEGHEDAHVLPFYTVSLSNVFLLLVLSAFSYECNVKSYILIGGERVGVIEG